MKKTTRKEKTTGPAGRTRPDGAEIYAAPPPPSKGRIVGLDCHPDTFTAAVFRGSTPHDARRIASREDMSLESLLEWAAKQFGAGDLFLMEAGSNSFEICGRLRQLGLRAAVLESAHVGRHAKTYADNDRMAAARIALVYLAGNAPCVWVPDETTRQRRELLHAHRKAVRDHTAATNAFKGYLNGFAIRLGKRDCAAPATREWIAKQREWSPLQRELLEEHFSELDSRAARRKRLSLLVRREVCAEPLMLRVMKLLGIGPVNAFAVLAVVGDVRRFESPEKLVAYVGLNPGRRQSGRGKNLKVGVGRRGRGDLRHLLVQGAQAVLRSGRDTPLGKWGWKLFARKGQRNIAVAGVARKLLVQIWHLLSGNPPSALEPDKSLSAKFTRLAASLGKTMRAETGFPPRLAECAAHLHSLMLRPEQSG